MSALATPTGARSLQSPANAVVLKVPFVGAHARGRHVAKFKCVPAIRHVTIPMSGHRPIQDDNKILPVLPFTFFPCFGVFVN